MLDPDMPAQQMRLHMGEMTAQEMRTARAAIRWANSALSTVTPAEVGGLVDVQAIETQAWNCAEWPEWLHKIVDQTNFRADETDMSSEQAIAYAVLTALKAQAAELAAERAAHAETKRERDEARQALEKIAAIEPVSNCDAGSMARSRMRDIARYSIAGRQK